MLLFVNFFSTGIDNSGVYIAVDYIVKSIVSGGNEVDVYGTARTVIKERMLSIASLVIINECSMLLICLFIFNLLFVFVYFGFHVFSLEII